jgi:gustatory receptor
MKQTTDPLELAVLVTFSFSLQKRPPIITCGLFDFDWKLIFSIISSAVTNFVILMQFDLAGRQKTN